ncbi:branched-chain amino acid ABC transporter permease [Ramlibacter sp. G-1-2-2]|uniref:Branched-chain amino acid ABC transporter permease n=1 Tax=Ramlibacter agri TaxID=2728837 RepID=A0A848HDW8_9BURK|nr:branched-chain amino acid ABC transporter permease [Ramlibacter agri]
MSFAHMRRRAVARMRRPLFREGFRTCLPLSIGISAWGVVAGVAIAKGGISLPLAIMMSVLVSAGSSQLAALPLISSDAPMWVVWATVACVNLRFLVYSFQYRPYFAHLPRSRRVVLSYFMGDTIFGIFLRRYPEPKREPGQVDFFWGAAIINWGCWQAAVITGILAGHAIPQEWGIGFAGTMALLALTCSQLRNRSTWVAAGVAGCAAVAAYALPLRMNIVVAIAAAVAIGVLAHHARKPEAA